MPGDLGCAGARADLVQADFAPELPGELALQHLQPRIGTTQRLEAAETEARPLVLVEDRTEAERVGQGRKAVQGGRCISRPCGDLGRRGGEVAALTTSWAAVRAGRSGRYDADIGGFEWLEHRNLPYPCGCGAAIGPEAGTDQPLFAGTRRRKKNGAGGEKPGARDREVSQETHVMSDGRGGVRGRTFPFRGTR